jgi:hypothetical protein
MIKYRCRSCRYCGKIHESAPVYEFCSQEIQKQRSHLATPMIILDTQNDIKSMADGKIYSSKSEMRKVYKQKGLIEVGDQAPMTTGAQKTSDSENIVIEAYKKVRDGYKPPPLNAYTEI